jgi:hypothetical protein
VPVGGRPDGDDARDGLAVIDPHLEAQARRLRADGKQVIADAEAPRLRRRQLLETGRRRAVQVAAARRADVPGDALAAPAQVVGRGDVREEVEPELVADVAGGLDEPRGVDDDRCLAVPLLDLDESRNAVEVQDATPRIS